MSVCRRDFDCDLYIYEHVKGFYVCQRCLLGGNKKFEKYTVEGVKFKTYAGVLSHCRKHKRAGHKVPSYLCGNLDEQKLAE